MKIIGISTARNEQDIIEAFVRHTLAYCDQLIIIDHGSTDATPAILKSLKEEGLALEVIRDETVGLIQTALMNRLSRKAVDDYQADWIFCLDADEFVQGDVRRVLSEHEAANGPDYIQYWLVNYVVRLEDDASELNPVKRIKHRTMDEATSSTDRRTCKSIVSGRLARQEGFFIGSGSHNVSLDGEEPPFKVINDIWLGHFSLRSPCQYAGKAVSAMFQRYGQRAKLMGNWDFYEADYRRLRESYTEFASDFVNIPLPWWSKTITGIECRPIDYRGGDLRYTPTASDVDQFIKTTLDWGHHMAQMTTAVQTAGEEDKPTKAFISLKEGENTIQKLSFESNTASFLELRFSLRELAKRDKLTLEFSGGAGALEVQEIALQLEDGTQRNFRETDLEDIITMAKGGMAARGGPVQRFFSSIPPITLNVWGCSNQTSELIFHLRFLNRHQMVSTAIGEYSGIAWFDKQLRKRDRAPAFIKTPLDAVFALSPMEPNCVAVGEGWRSLHFSGLWLAKSKGAIGLRFAEVQMSTLKLRFEVVTRPDKNQPPNETGTIRVFADGAPIANWSVAKKSRQWLEVNLPENLGGRRGIDLTFEREGSDFSFGIKRISVEPERKQGWLAGLLRRTLDFLERGSNRQEKRNLVTLGETIRFDQKGKGLAIATAGWAQPKDSGCRAETAQAVLRFTITPAVAEGIKAKLLLVGGEEAGIVRLAWESMDMASWWLEAQTPEWVEVTLPAGAAKKEEIFLLLRSSEKSAGFELREMILEAANA